VTNHSLQRTEFLVHMPLQGAFHFRCPGSELVLSDVYWLWIYDALTEMTEDGQRLRFVEAVENGFQDPRNLVETIPVSSRFLDLVAKIPSSRAPSFERITTSDGSCVPTPEQLLTEFQRLVSAGISAGSIEMEIE
jgi:hypothetical protein